MSACEVTGYLGEPLRESETSCVLRVWCDWCCVWHSHGVPCDVSAGTVTYRLPHCYAPDSPYRRSGCDYGIRVSAVPFEDVERSVRRVSSSQERVIREGRCTPGVRRLREQRPRPQSQHRSRSRSGGHRASS